ncbi:hypothetical protein SUGI_1059350 [Cryptomeria japonica]|nr:hypothetical protein SUGI_1059350 [Cryptomeria japonica]
MTGSYTDASTDAYGLDAYPAFVFAMCASTDATESYESGPRTTHLGGYASLVIGVAPSFVALADYALASTGAYTFAYLTNIGGVRY